MIERYIFDSIQNKFFKGKAILLLGPRQVGKTTLIKAILAHRKESTLFLDGDDSTAVDLIENANTETLRQLIGGHTIVFIDEAQRIPHGSLKAKIIVDQFKEIQVIISGSSAFDLNNQLQEPLTGRKWTYYLWPICWWEYEKHIGFLKAEQSLEQRLVYGFYPDVIRSGSDQEEVLTELASSYLYKDVLMHANIKRPELIHKILKALAYQIGSEVQYKEVAEIVGADPKTVNYYIEILEKVFIIFSLPSFSGNLRNEIKTARKIYFYDNGLRNAVIGDFKPIVNRKDVGALWENFLISERRKVNSYQKKTTASFFWRTKQQQEIDYIEETGGKISAYEFKWNPKRKTTFPKPFTEQYKSENQTISRTNFREFLSLSLSSQTD